MLLALLIALAPAGQEGDAQAFTSVSDPQGKALADGRYAQEVRDGLLRIEARYDFADGRVAVEHATLRLLPQIEQESWDFTERKDGRLIRSYEVDLRTRKAVATRADEEKSWREDVDVEPGKTFCGIGFVIAVKALRDSIPAGKSIELGVIAVKALRDSLPVGKSIELGVIAFTPKPRSATVSIIHRGPETLRMAGRSVHGDRFDIHPEIPAIARLFVHVPDQHIWLVEGGPPAFLRFEGQMVEKDDPTIVIDLIPGPPAHAQPRARPPPRR